VSAPAKTRGPRGPRKHRLTHQARWYSAGPGHAHRHAIRRWVAGPNRQIVALCGVTAPLWLEADTSLSACPSCATLIFAPERAEQ
jgi:hypothetical protein